jgi:hypothetical protein
MQKIITLSIADSKNSLVFQYDLNIYATLAKICQAATFLAHVIFCNLEFWIKNYRLSSFFYGTDPSKQ